MILSSLVNGKVVKKEVSHVSFDFETQILVVGAGSAGVFVCDSACKEGAQVTLFEQSNTLGGMHAKGCVTGFYMGSSGGSFEKDLAKNDTDTIFYFNDASWEQKQIRATERLKLSGAKIFVNTVVLGIYFVDNVAVGVTAFDGEKRFNVKTKFIVDATSDGHLIRMTSVKKRYGRDFDGSTAPFTIRRQYLSGDKFISNNDDSGYINQYDPFDFSNCIINARASAKDLVINEKFISLASYTGVREGLSFRGEQTITYKEFTLRKHCGKTLLYIYSDLDKHGYDRAVDCEGFQDWWVISNLSTVAVNAPVPLGVVVPKNVKGLVTAGRCISADCYTQGAVRMNKDMFRMGECLGVALAIAVKSNVDLIDIDYQKYLNRVTELGCFMGNCDREYAFEATKRTYDNKMKTLNKIPDKKYDGLNDGDSIYFKVDFDLTKTYPLLYTDEPGVAFWSCYVYKNKRKLADYLYKELTATPNELYKYNLAIALGLIKDKRCVNTLVEIIKNRDCFYFADNRRSNQFRSVIAVCLLGRLGTAFHLPLLDDILSPCEEENKIYHTLTPNNLFHRHKDRNFLYFQMITHTLTAYIKICKRHKISDYEKYLTPDKIKFFSDKILSGMGNAQSIEEVTNFFKHAQKLK